MLRRCFCAAFLIPAYLPAQTPAAKELRIIKTTFHQSEDGPPLVPPVFGPGDTVFFSFQVQGFKTGPDASVDLAWTLDVLDAAGVKLVETAQKELKSHLSEEDKEWMPIVRHSFMIPPIMLPGNGRIVAVVDDRIAKKQVKGEFQFEIRGHKVELSDTLTAREFHFVRAEDDPAPLHDPAYRPGDTVWARFDIVGFKYGERNRLRVQYGIAIADASGKILFQQSDAAVEEKESFYPMKYVPGVISLTTQKNTRPGEYILVLMLKDDIGSVTAEERHPFRLE